MNELAIRAAKAMIPIFCDHGMPISCPDDGDLDDVEMERWNALVEAAGAAIEAAREPTEAMLEAMLTKQPCRADMWRAAIDEILK